jgi:hypothetical protein
MESQLLRFFDRQKDIRGLGVTGDWPGDIEPKRFSHGPFYGVALFILRCWKRVTQLSGYLCYSTVPVRNLELIP